MAGTRYRQVARSLFGMSYVEGRRRLGSMNAYYLADICS